MKYKVFLAKGTKSNIVAEKVVENAPGAKDYLEFFLAYFEKNLSKYHRSEEIESSDPTITEIDYCWNKGVFIVDIRTERKDYSYGSQSYYHLKEDFRFVLSSRIIYENESGYNLATHKNSLIRRLVKATSQNSGRGKIERGY